MRRFAGGSSPLFGSHALKDMIGQNPPPVSFFAILWRAAHQSPPETYEKNPVDSSHPLTVPDEVLQPPDSDTYWAPHPETGVFGPADEIHASCHHSDTSPPTHPHPAAGAGEESSSALGQSVWFRPHEADERPPPDYL